jgi:hypothetical protein
MNFKLQEDSIEAFNGHRLTPVPRDQKKKTKRAAGSPAASTQLALRLRLASMNKAESWQHAVTLDNSTPQ